MYIVAIGIGMGLVPEVAPGFFDQLPHVLAPILHAASCSQR
jgi:uric acid transporter